MVLADQERRFELSSFGESEEAKLAKSMLHVASLGFYKQQAKRDNISIVDCNRRVTYQLSFLDWLTQAETPPEIAYDIQHIKSSVRELSSFMPAVSSPRVRLHAETTLERLKSLSKDAELQADCTTALAVMKQTDALRDTMRAEVAALPRGVAHAAASSERGRAK
jgi:hypothetical protein